MAKRALIAGWFDADTKVRFAAAARMQEISESALLKRLVSAVLLSVPGAPDSDPEPIRTESISSRLSVRVRDMDLPRLRDRAAARQIPTSTYVTYLIEAHLSADPPLPTAEFLALRQSVLAVSAMGRNLNQIARTLNEGGHAVSPGTSDLSAYSIALRKLSAEYRNLLEANRASWRTSYD
jgi:hypothetical protein